MSERTEFDVASYIEVRNRSTLTRTIQVTESMLVDVAGDGRILGIETIGGASINWWAILADDRFGFRQ